MVTTGERYAFQWQAELWAEQQPSWEIRGALAFNGATWFVLTCHVDPSAYPHGEYWQWRVAPPCFEPTTEAWAL